MWRRLHCDESGLVRWMLIAWFIVFAAAYGALFGAVLNLLPLDADSRVAAVRYFGLGGVIVGTIGAKVMTRKRYQTPTRNLK